ncbi:PIN domain-containing protein [Halomarina pelagica]|uniref:PIN domain-containing protein n=1 Tax=Halomarina pelagica TaxID=2961599 RepID=UPI0020C402F4|nr:PIN domain-containing protein [Halomarina sp. BND7]
MLLDTDFIIDVMIDHAGATATLDALEADERVLFVPTPALFELYHSISRVNVPDGRRAAIEAVLESYPTVPADATVMRKAGRIHGDLAAGGDEIGPMDAIIGAMGVVRSEPVLTANGKHFERIPGLTVETYEKA